MKKPSTSKIAAPESVIGKPKKKQEKNSGLTQDNLKQRNSLLTQDFSSAEDVEEAITKLSKKDQMSLWKKFELDRQGHDPTDAQYKQATQGKNQLMKKRKMLRGWVLDKGMCGKHYKDCVISFAHEKPQSVEGVWLSQTEAVDKYGNQQLLAMYEAGTIMSRRMPSDPRFFEFKAVTQKENNKITGIKTTAVRSSGSKA